MRLLALVPLIVMPASAFAADLVTDLRACASVPDAAMRLSCFDDLAARSAEPKTPAPAPAPARGQSRALDFGLPQQPEGVSISAHLAAGIDEVRKGSSIPLDNGQLWKVTENPPAYYGASAAGTEVSVTTTLTNGYRMSVKGVPVPYKVKRVK